MPCGSRPFVGSSSTSSRGARSSAAASPSRCRMPSEYAFTGRRADAAETRPGRSASSTRPRRGRAVRAAAAAGVEERQVGPRRQVPVRRRTLDEGADPRQHRCAPAASARRSSSTRPEVGSTRPEHHPHGRRLARAVRAEEAVDVALADVEVDVVDGQHRPEPLGQPVGADHRANRRCRGARSGPRQRCLGHRADQQPPCPGIGAPRQAQGQRAERERDRRVGRAGTAGQLLVDLVGEPRRQRDDGQRRDPAPVEPDRAGQLRDDRRTWQPGQRGRQWTDTNRLIAETRSGSETYCTCADELGAKAVSAGWARWSTRRAWRCSRPAQPAARRPPPRAAGRCSPTRTRRPAGSSTRAGRDQPQSGGVVARYAPVGEPRHLAR